MSTEPTYIEVNDIAKLLDIQVAICREYLRQGVFTTAFKRHGTRWVADVEEVLKFRKEGIPVAGIFSRKQK